MEIANQLYCPNKVCLGLETQQVCVQVIQMHFNQVVPLMTFSDTKIHSVYSVQNWLQRQNNESLTTNFSYNNYYTQGTFGVLVLIPTIFLFNTNKLNSMIHNRVHIFYKDSYIFPEVYIHFAVNLFYAEFLTEVQNIFFFVSKFLEMCKGCLGKSFKCSLGKNYIIKFIATRKHYKNTLC